MTINLISQDQYNRLLEIQKNYPKLTFENKGYEYIDKKTLNEDELKAFKEVESILKLHIVDFIEFNNFCHLRSRLRIRLQYIYNTTNYFTGVGYLFVDELLNGFDNNKQNI